MCRTKDSCNNIPGLLKAETNHCDLKELLKCAQRLSSMSNKPLRRGNQRQDYPPFIIQQW